MHGFTILHSTKLLMHMLTSLVNQHGQNFTVSSYQYSPCNSTQIGQFCLNHLLSSLLFFCCSYFLNVTYMAWFDSYVDVIITLDC
jgi:hypothetical protein